MPDLRKTLKDIALGKAYKGEIYMYVDYSGSISHKEMNAFLKELKKVTAGTICQRTKIKGKSRKKK